MINRVKHNAGFTLAEVLLAVAIILVLAAIAIPSVISAQNNMRMVELDNAAEAIANAAQTQMTAKKASGTWLALIEQGGEGGEGGEGSEGGEKHEVKYPAAINGAADTYYMVASDNGALKGARNNGIIPGLSIDEQVRAGDFIIVFRASTASVVGVYYTDGKNGFFGTADPGTKAQIYYEGGGSTDRSTRMRNNPMIGYYEGTPAGATDAVALENPVVKVDEEGKLCVQNPNLTVGPQKDWNSVAGITLTNQSESDRKGAVLAITNIQKELSSFYVGIPGGASIQVFGPEVMDFIKLATWNSEVAGDPNAYQIDLEALKAKMKNSENADVQALAAKFSVGDKLKVQASITLPDGSRPFVPATAQANIEWPAPPAKLRIFLTNPAPETNAEGHLLDTNPAHEFITGAYTHPLVKTLSDIASDLGIDAHADEDSRELTKYNAAVTKKLVAENPEAGRQAYSGGWLDLNAVAAVATDAVPVKVQATVGSYTPAGSAKHEYQIVEIWINGTLAGYVKDNAWLWVGDAGAQLQPCLEGVVPAENTTQLVLNAGMLNNSSIPKDEDGGYTVYVRTAPRIGEMQGYFDANVKEFAALLNSGNTTGARGTNLASTSRKRIENEFGAPSTVALWNITRSTTSGITTSSGKTFPEQAGEMRIYYAATPALGFNSNNVDPSNQLRNAALWYYAGPNFEKRPAAMVRDSRQENANLVVTAAGNANLGVVATSSDFEIPFNRDYLFYRVLEYCDQDGERLEGFDLQYLPYSVMNDEKHAAIKAEPEVPEKNPLGWLVEGNSTWPKGKSFILAPDTFGTLVGAYDGNLAYGYVQLKAQYQKIVKSVGLMYVEFGDAANATGYYGTFDGTTMVAGGVNADGSTRTDALPADNVINEWDYYVVVPASSNDVPQASLGLIWQNLDYAREATIQGTSYKLYYAPEYKIISYASPTYYFKCADTAPFRATYNPNFAAAIDISGGSQSDTWGEGTPWNLRTASQFSNIFKHLWSPLPNNNYQQTHDIDFAQEQRITSTTFLGTFDGRGFSLLNFDLSKVDSMYQTGTAGLFPVLQGATLRNINLQVVPAERPVTLSTGAVGFLVGSIAPDYSGENRLENCSVVGKTADGSPAKTEVNTGWEATGAMFGGLAGEASGVTVKNCTVSNVALSLVNEQVVGYNEEVLCGGFIGSVWDQGASTSIDVVDLRGQLVVDTVQFSMKGDASTYAGGILGRGRNNMISGGLGNIKRQFEGVTMTRNGASNSVEDPIGTS